LIEINFERKFEQDHCVSRVNEEWSDEFCITEILPNRVNCLCSKLLATTTIY